MPLSSQDAMNLTGSITLSAFLHTACVAVLLATPAVMNLDDQRARHFDEQLVRAERMNDTPTASLELAWHESVDDTDEARGDVPLEVADAAQEPNPAEDVSPETPLEEVLEEEPVAETARELEPSPTNSAEEPVEREYIAEDVDPLTSDEESDLELVVDAAPHEPDSTDASGRTAEQRSAAEESVPEPSDAAEVPVDGRDAPEERMAHADVRLEEVEQREVEPAPSVDVDALLAGYTSALNDLVRGNYDYPRIARRAGLQGRVIVAVILDEEGRIVEVLVRESSGHQVLDRAAIASIEEIDRFPAPPPEMDWDRRPIEIPMVYSL